MITHALFPTAVTFETLEREFTQEENSFFEKISKSKHKLMGNSVSDNSYILNEPEMAELKKFVEQCITEYIISVCQLTDGHQIEITQSWINFTEKGEFHHKHKHPNSFLSGVFYISADPEKDKIHFFKDVYQQIKPIVKDYNVFNSDSWFFKVGSMQLVLFPSSLEHMVEPVESDKTRISLAFNTFFKGSIGSERSLTELKI